jgi:hypothetical protein
MTAGKNSRVRRFLQARRGLSAALACVALGLGGASVAAPYRPTNDDQVLEHLPAGVTGAAAQLRALQRSHAAAPRDLDRALALAEFYARLGRTEADPRLYSYAEGVIRPWSAEALPPPRVVLLRARILQFRHAFDAALDDLDGLIGRGVDDPQVWLLKASILKVQGHYAAAMDSCAHLQTYRDPLVPLTCAAEVQSLGGDARAALANLSKPLELRPRAPSDDPGVGSVTAWSEQVLAGIAEREGDVRSAERWYRAALALTPDDAYTLTAYCDFLLDQRRPAEVKGLAERRQAIDGLFLRLALAEHELDPAEARRLDFKVQARFDAVRARGDQPHLGEEARFELVLRGNSKTAYRYALANWKLLREPRDAMILAQAALATGDGRAARDALRQLAAQDVNDVRLARVEAGLKALAG